MTSSPQVWDGAISRLRNEIPAFSFDAWLAPLEAREHEGGLLLLCPSNFHRERVRTHYLPFIDRCVQEVTGGEIQIELGVTTQRVLTEVDRDAVRKPDGARAPNTRCVDEVETSAPETNSRQDSERTRGAQILSIPRRAARAGDASRNPPQRTSGGHATPTPLTFENFVVGPCNALAREAAFAMASDQQHTLSQLYLCADPGMGKTHLARAVAAEANCHGACEVKYVSSESFTNQFLSALRSNRTAEFKRRYRGRQQFLVVDDIQFLEHKSATQLEFFHTVQHILDAGGKVILTGDRMPQEMPELGPRIRSHLGSGFVAELEPPDRRVRRAILRKKAAHGGVRLPEDCLDVLVESVVGSVRDLEGALIQLVTTASLLKCPIDLDLTQSAIEKKGGRQRPRRLLIGDVIAVVAAFFRCDPSRLASRSRKREVLLPRQLAMYLCRRYTEAPLAEIGKALGRDHPAVRNAIQKIEREMLERPPLRYQVEALGERLDEIVSNPERNWSSQGTAADVQRNADPSGR